MRQLLPLWTSPAGHATLTGWMAAAGLFFGEYLFIAVLPEGYICDPLPSVKVTLGEADMLVLNNTITEGHITVTASKGGEVLHTRAAADFCLL